MTGTLFNVILIDQQHARGRSQSCVGLGGRPGSEVRQVPGRMTPTVWLLSFCCSSYCIVVLQAGNPFLFWEPSDEASILEVITQYTRGPINSNGFRFAINIDLVQVRVLWCRWVFGAEHAVV
jgi:hypothetical protein